MTGLDPAAQSELYDLILHLNRKYHMTILMISHDIAAAARYSNKILHLEDNTYFYGTLTEYKTSDLYQNWKGEM